MALSPAQRTLHARLAAHALHASRDSRELTAPARKAFLDRFKAQVIEAAAKRGEVVSPEEIRRRAEHAKRSYFTKLALESSRARRKSVAT
jgi:hypothetical protein